MRVDKLNTDLINDKAKKESEALLNKEKVLCNYCQRTTSNGIRCLGMCVADNEY